MRYRHHRNYFCHIPLILSHPSDTRVSHWWYYQGVEPSTNTLGHFAWTTTPTHPPPLPYPTSLSSALSSPLFNKSKGRVAAWSGTHWRPSRLQAMTSSLQDWQILKVRPAAPGHCPSYMYPTVSYGAFQLYAMSEFIAGDVMSR